MGLDATAAAARARSQSRGRSLTRKRVRGEDAEMVEGDAEPQKRIHSSKSRWVFVICFAPLAQAGSDSYENYTHYYILCRSMSRGRALSTASAEPNKGLRDASQRNKSIKLNDKAQVKMGRAARKGEADRHIPGAVESLVSAVCMYLSSNVSHQVHLASFHVRVCRSQAKAFVEWQTAAWHTDRR